MTAKKKDQSKQHAPLEASGKRTTKGPEPERLKISGYKNWEDAIAPILGRRRPPGGWAK
jgi:hypothetical protein